MTGSIDLAPPQKAAAILVALGRERAAKLLEHFQQEEIRTLLLITKELENIPQQVLNDLVEEFEADYQTGAGLMDSSSTMQSIIEDALTPEQLADLKKGEDVVEIALQTKSAWEILEEVDNGELLDFLTVENPQISAFVLSKIRPNKSAEIVSELDSEARKRIVSSMISSRSVLPEAVEMLELILKEKFGRSIGRDKGIGSQRLVAGIMNELDQEVSESLFSELADTVQQDALQSVKSMMFRFADIVVLDAPARAAIFDQVATEVTTLALQEATPELTEAVLSTLGQRTRRMMESELGNASTVSPEDIKEAQKQVTSTILQLAADGAITLPAPELAA